MSHYFTNSPELGSKPRIISYSFNSVNFSLKSDMGVFSKNNLDEGSEAFIKVLLSQKLYGRILDVGCGIGPIGLTLATFNPHLEFMLIDVNARACTLARENANSLKLKNVQVKESNIYENVEGNFDFIVTNPPIRAGKKVIYKMFEEAKGLLNINGSLFIVIRKDQGAQSAQRFIASVFGNCQLLKRDRGYYIYQAIKCD